MDQTITIGRPSEAVSRDIFAIHLRKVPVSGITKEEAAEIGAKELFSPEYAFYEASLSDGTDEGNDRKTMRFLLGNLASGAMIANIIEKAARSALRRDIKAGVKTGITEGDIKAAVVSVFRQNETLNHTDDLEAFFKDVEGRLIGIKKLRQVSA
jgi:SpoVK/Ycf46/Vps4 family AAA+-type ATPase